MKIIESYTKEWEVLLNGKLFTNGLKDETACLREIYHARMNGYSGRWSYRELIINISIGKTFKLTDDE